MLTTEFQAVAGFAAAEMAAIRSAALEEATDLKPYVGVPVRPRIPKVGSAVAPEIRCPFQVQSLLMLLWLLHRLL